MQYIQRPEIMMLHNLLNQRPLEGERFHVAAWEKQNILYIACAGKGPQYMYSMYFSNKSGSESESLAENIELIKKNDFFTSCEAFCFCRNFFCKDLCKY